MQRENTRSGQKRDKKGFESEGRAGMLHQQRGWADERSSTVELCKRRVRTRSCASDEEVTVLVEVGSPEEAGTQQGEQLQE